MAADPRPLTAEIDTSADAQQLWRVLADVRRTGEWSPECRRVLPVGRLRRGGLLLGFNRRGRTRWATVSRVTACEPGRRLEWRVLTNRSQWCYELQPTSGGCRLRQTRRTPRGESGFAVWFTERFLGGQAGHDAELEAAMTAGLRTIAELARREVRPAA